VVFAPSASARGGLAGEGEEVHDAISDCCPVAAFGSFLVTMPAFAGRDGRECGFLNEAFDEEEEHESDDFLFDHLRGGAVEAFDAVADFHVAESDLDAPALVLDLN